MCEADRPTLHKCLYRGAEYVKGEKFYPRDNPCFQCTCDENFRDHQVHQPNCRKYACHYETIYKDKILDNCAPVYGETECCAIDWICRKWPLYLFVHTIKNFAVFSWFSITFSFLLCSQRPAKSKNCPMALCFNFRWM